MSINIGFRHRRKTHAPSQNVGLEVAPHLDPAKFWISKVQKMFTVLCTFIWLTYLVLVGKTEKQLY